jgi:hypothetical protein
VKGDSKLGTRDSKRRRLVPALEPDADPACRLTPEGGARRKPDVERLFATLAEQKRTDEATLYAFRGDPNWLWDEVSSFVDEESVCCPFYTFEQTEEADGVLLRVSGGDGAGPLR